MDIPQIKDKNRISLEETREMQRIILGILEAIDKVCRKHNQCSERCATTASFRGTTMPT